MKRLISLAVLVGVFGAQSQVFSSESASSSPKPGVDSYILGPGDSLFIEFHDTPSLNGNYSIGPDGLMYLPRLRALKVSGLTISELRLFLESQFKEFLVEPEIYIRPVGFRPVRVYVGGEVERPGYYVLKVPSPANATLSGTSTEQVIPDNLRQDVNPSPVNVGGTSTLSQTYYWPTVFDALRSAQGVTPFSDLSKVGLIRRSSIGQGSQKMSTTVPFIRMLTEGDESVNIEVMDGDVISVQKSEVVLKEQLLEASRSNLSSEFISVYVTGQVINVGTTVVRQGSSLNQAIASAGGPKLLRGAVEFIRLSREGKTERRKFGLSPNAKPGEYKNPVLMSGDIIRINDSLFSSTVQVLNEVTGPAVGIYSLYSLFKP